MSIRDDIDRVIEEEMRVADRKNRVLSRSAPRKAGSYRTRFQQPTYFAIVIGKILYKLRKPQKARQKITPKKGMEGYVEEDFINRPKPTMFTIFKEDLGNLPKRLFFIGMKKKKSNAKPPNSNESIEDWKDFFEDIE